ncbi:MAG: arginine repressor [Lactovum sp.]
MRKTSKQTQEERRQLIKKIISENQISTQMQLLEVLFKEGIDVTQATLSRDMKEIGLAKFRKNDMNYYAVYDQAQVAPDFTMIYREFILSVQSVMFMIVCHTRLGEADLLANEFDESNRPEILGTIAGADTLLIVCQNMKSADDLVKEIQEAIKRDED